MCDPTGVKANGLTGKLAMAAALGFFEDSGLGTGEGETGAEEGEEVGLHLIGSPGRWS